RMLSFRTDIRSNHWFFSLYLADARHERDAVIAALSAEKIQSRPIWALINEQKPYVTNETCGMTKAEEYRAKIVNLPCSTNLSMQDAQRVVDALLML
ncbi:MAG: DegT/DnrJ/EryC1/StrS family aminotransferase, partial [Pygmaiobacter sp.]